MDFNGTGIMGRAGSAPAASLVTTRTSLKLFFSEPIMVLQYKQEVHMSTLLEFAMFPTDKGESVSEYVSRVLKVIDGEGHPYTLTAMGTIIEVENLDDALKIVKKAYKQLERDCNRVYSTIKLDVRKGKSGRLKQKIASVEKKVGKKLT
jgi:uncharacterized protein (TIGR00106 family)